MNSEILELAQKYGGYVGVNAIAVLAIWLRFSKARTDVSGHDLRRAADESIRETMKDLKADLHQEVTRRIELENREKALIEMSTNAKFLAREQAARILRLEDRVENLLQMVAEAEGANSRIVQAYSNTVMGDLND